MARFPSEDRANAGHHIEGSYRGPDGRDDWVNVRSRARGLLVNAISFGVSFCCLTALRAPRDRRSGAPAAGIVMASLGVGGVLGALAARPLGRRFGTARAMVITVAGGLCFAPLLPLTDKGSRLAFAGIAMMCTGCVIVIGNVIVDSFMQTYVPPDIFGRVTSATWAVGFAMMPVGALFAGALATVLGVRATLWILTALIAASGLLYLLAPMRHLRDLPQRSPLNQSAHASSS